MLTWNVYYEDFNHKKIETFNIFDHGRFLEDCQKNARKFRGDREGFAEAVRKDLMYYYWSKCEWEIVLGSLFGREGFRELKIDVYDQVRLNWDAFIDYIWRNKSDLSRQRSNDED